MPNNFKYRSGLSSAGAYQVSGVPFLSGSGHTIKGTNSAAYKVEFPYVTQWVTIENTHASNGLRVGFSEFGVRGQSGETADAERNYIVLPARDDGLDPLSRITLNVRVKDIYLSCDHATNTVTAQIAAGVTMVPREELTGTYDNWTGSSGVG
jgi:hypothetical protein